MWKEILENRNFIYEQITNIINPKVNLPPDAPIELKEIERKKQEFTNELLDITWNFVKLANISRKHGLPNLTLYYVNMAKTQLHG
jgi:hypothetical protein